MADDELPLATAEWREHAARKFSQAELAELSHKLSLAEAQGWRLVRYSPCNVSWHRHKWRWLAWLCDALSSIYEGEWDDE